METRHGPFSLSLSVLLSLSLSFSGKRREKVINRISHSNWAAFSAGWVAFRYEFDTNRNAERDSLKNASSVPSLAPRCRVHRVTDSKSIRGEHPTFLLSETADSFDSILPSEFQPLPIGEPASLSLSLSLSPLVSLPFSPPWRQARIAGSFFLPPWRPNQPSFCSSSFSPFEIEWFAPAEEPPSADLPEINSYAKDESAPGARIRSLSLCSVKFLGKVASTIAQHQRTHGRKIPKRFVPFFFFFFFFRLLFLSFFLLVPSVFFFLEKLNINCGCKRRGLGRWIRVFRTSSVFCAIFFCFLLSNVARLENVRVQLNFFEILVCFACVNNVLLLETYCQRI